MSEPASARRPIKARDTRWAAAIATWMAGQGIRPNTISVCSALFAGLAGFALWLTPNVGAGAGSGLFLLAAGGIQLRLLCNLFDGMVAIEGGFKTKSGDIFNELPDRFADVFVLVGCGYAAGRLPGGVMLGWLAAVLAVGTAYVRALGASVGVGQCFLGPMAKQHRMATVTLASLACTALVFHGWAAWGMGAALVVVVAGGAVTIARRALWIVRALEARP
ncbi:MAG TPA: CDP-alcohol phosphatidyltransferase family protein [Lacunisphaera sp.]|nr:CDP-alcohol phosphatidyltransferase family protein [Lacunisphaera sp.]